jgi:glyoxylase-like metal-dependent hydrolase (beta-lactamase superfamily II)
VAGGTNITASIGPDGVLLVDTGPEKLGAEVRAAIREIQQRLAFSRTPPPIGGAETRSATKALFDPPPVERDYIPYILNTNPHPDHIGGNAGLAIVPRELSAQDPNENASKIYAHENVLLRLSAAVGDAPEVPFEFRPSNVYYEDYYKLPRFNGEGIQLMHVASANTDGDSIVWFRRSDVISAGDIYRTDTYPTPDLEKGGTIQGVIEGLNVLLDIVIPEYRAEGGTLVIPGHGRISDQGDVASYRDMVTIVRDRIQRMIGKGMTLDEIKAAQPTFDYDPRYAKQPGTADRFIEAVHRSLTTAGRR